MTTHPVFRAASELTTWAREVLSMRIDVVLATNDADSAPHLVPVWYAIDGDRVLIASGSATRKVRNLRRDPRVRMLFQAPPVAAGRTGWVMAHGTAELVHGEESTRLNELAVARYLTEDGLDGWNSTMAPLLDVTIVVTPDAWMTWTDDPMFEQIESHGHRREVAEGWLLPYDH